MKRISIAQISTVLQDLTSLLNLFSNTIPLQYRYNYNKYSQCKYNKNMEIKPKWNILNAQGHCPLFTNKECKQWASYRFAQI